MYLCLLLQAGSFALVASILYEVDGHPHRSVFYNGTIEVIEASGFASGETIFLVTLGSGLLGLLGMWLYGQFQKLSKVSYTILFWCKVGIANFVILFAHKTVVLFCVEDTKD